MCGPWRWTLDRVGIDLDTAIAEKQPSTGLQILPAD